MANNFGFDDDAGDALEPWPLEIDGREPPWLVSATDLLVSWSPHPALGQGHSPAKPDDWDQYFASRPNNSGAAHATSESPSCTQPPGEDWDADAAECCVEVLFRLIHALERADVPASMDCIAEEYHHMENDREVDRDALRLQFEAYVDTWRGGHARISLTEVPQPVFHPAGVLIQVTLQVDYWRRSDERDVTDLLSRMVVLDESPDRQWRICAISPLSSP